MDDAMAKVEAKREVEEANMGERKRRRLTRAEEVALLSQRSLDVHAASVVRDLNDSF